MRLTVFPVETPEVAGLRWWSELTGEQPLIRNEFLKSGSLKETGKFGVGELELVVRPSRIDWNLRAIPDEEGNPPNLGAPHESLEKFHSLMNKWLGIGRPPEAWRLALGCVLLSLAPSVSEVHKTISRFGKISIDGADISDVLFQINRPIRVEWGNEQMKMNRLIKLSEAVLEQVEVEVGLTPAVRTIGQRAFACQLELDVNTDPQREKWKFDSKQQGAMLGILKQTATEVISTGGIQ